MGRAWHISVAGWGFVTRVEEPWLPWVTDSGSEQLLPGRGRASGRGLAVGFQPAELSAAEGQIWGLTFSLVVARKTPEVWLS